MFLSQVQEHIEEIKEVSLCVKPSISVYCSSGPCIRWGELNSIV